MNFTIPQLLIYESDINRRQRERELYAGGPEAEVRFLRDKLRKGEITQSRLRAAAMLGDPIAEQLAKDLEISINSSSSYHKIKYAAYNLEPEERARFFQEFLNEYVYLYEIIGEQRLAYIKEAMSEFSRGNYKYALPWAVRAAESAYYIAYDPNPPYQFNPGTHYALEFANSLRNAIESMLASKDQSRMFGDSIAVLWNLDTESGINGKAFAIQRLIDLLLKRN